MRRTWMMSALIAVLVLPVGIARAATVSCSAAETVLLAGIGSRHCEITATCPAGTCNWKVTVSVSGIGTVHGWVDGAEIDCNGVNSCAASRTFALTSGQSRVFMCLMDAPGVAVNESMSCSGQTV